MQSEILKNASDKTPEFSHYPVDSKLLAELPHWHAGKAAAAKRSWIKGGSGGAGMAIWGSGAWVLIGSPWPAAAVGS